MRRRREDRWIAFDIPADQPSTDEYEPRQFTFWRVRLVTRLRRGLAVDVPFKVPIYRRPVEV